MRQIIEITSAQVAPSVEAVLKAQGILEIDTANDATIQLARQALVTYAELAEPTGVVDDIAAEQFESVFEGQGDNHLQAPLARIYPASDHLALFAVTIGEAICRRITDLFESHDYPAAAMLDSAASEGTELTANLLEQRLIERLRSQGLIDTSKKSLQFSPGYCGWHTSGQKKLFAYLRPGEIGIKLTETCLMQPLKSISGVIATGDRDLFFFDDNFEFCRNCRTRSCRQRQQQLTEN